MLGSIYPKDHKGTGKLREGGSKRANMRALARNNAMSPNNKFFNPDNVPKSAGLPKIDKDEYSYSEEKPKI